MMMMEAYPRVLFLVGRGQSRSRFFLIGPDCCASPEWNRFKLYISKCVQFHMSDSKIYSMVWFMTAGKKSYVIILTVWPG